jgi:membrane protein
MTSFADRARAVYRRANKLSGDSLEILQDTFEGFKEARGAEAAAGLAYYAFFSLFPLLIVLVAVGSSVLKGEQVYQQTVAFVSEAFPASQALIARNVQRILELRGAVGIFGLIGLLWSATGAFAILARNINRAWRKAEPRGFLESRLVAVGMAGILACFLVLSLFSTTIANLLPRLETPLWGSVSIYETSLWAVLSRCVPWFFSFSMFLALYRWTPSADVRWKAAVIGALIAALAWELVKGGFTWYLGSGLVRYELVYGSLGTVAALLFWIYISSYITLFGAHLSATVGRHTG